MGIFSRLFGGGSAGEESGAPARSIAELIAPISSPAVQIVRSDGPSRSGLGGVPNVPAGFEWPRKEGAPLSFLAQVDLGEVADVHAFDWLPDGGSMLFFYSLFHGAWGFDPKDEGCWRVVYAPAGATLEPMRAPEDLPAEARFPWTAARFRRVVVPPPFELSEMQALELTDHEADAVDVARHEAFEGEPMHQIGGFAANVQSPEMQLECQLASNGISVGDHRGYETARAKELEPGARDWRLLLQVDSDEAGHMMWGDLGRLYYWVRADEARAGCFDGAWLVLQCG